MKESQTRQNGTFENRKVGETEETPLPSQYLHLLVTAGKPTPVSPNESERLIPADGHSCEARPSPATEEGPSVCGGCGEQVHCGSRHYPATDVSWT